MKFVNLTGNELVNADLIERMYIGKYFVMVKCFDSYEECASDCASGQKSLGMRNNSAFNYELCIDSY